MGLSGRRLVHLLVPLIDPMPGEPIATLTEFEKEFCLRERRCASERLSVRFLRGEARRYCKTLVCSSLTSRRESNQLDLR